MLDRFAELSTPLIADACIRSGVPLRVAPAGIRGVVQGSRAGRALPARHYGSVDVFLEALGAAAAGDVLVIDNGGRTDEACIGDLVLLEAQGAGLSALIVWGLHRDTPELIEIGVPVFSYGSCPAGPTRLDEREPEATLNARFGPVLVSCEDVVFGTTTACCSSPSAASTRCSPSGTRSGRPNANRLAGSAMARHSGVRHSSTST